ncbi:hypothetical protein EOM89_00115 [Candidatus Falkowbacteria bacterium]|nr:hypothetical protein [Candidatus Falkowbacteria bacterium]
MTIRNWKEEDGKLGLAWPGAALLGILTFGALMMAGGLADTAALPVAGVVTVFFGMLWDWAFYGRDPETQLFALTDSLTPDTLPGNDDIFGKGSVDIKTLGLQPLVDLMGQNALMDGAPIMKIFGFGLK